MSIDATKHNVLKLGADLNTVIDNVKTELSENISVLRNQVTTVNNYAEKLVHQTNSLMGNRITTIEMSIDATKHDVSKMDADLNTVIDIVLLDQAATCKPNCANGGVCFRDNMLICEDKCYENGGRCVGPRKCECPENRHGPNCEQYYCIVPDEIDQRLSIFDRKRVTISSGSLVEDGNFVFFNCSDVDELGYEPWNRQFKCHNGLWVESERDRNWKLGNNGAFPACRKAVCEPECLHGGVCFKDDNCRCKEFLEGRRCEKVVCEDKCYENGGECIGPGICKCPEEQSGPNCEPKSVYYISVKTGWGIGAGTEAKVYITLHGQKGKTDKIYLEGEFERGGSNETRIEAKDIRPITSVVIGHDGSGMSPDWYLEYVSIYVENMEEYYVFRHNDWVEVERDVLLPRQGLDEQKCIDSFDSGHKWWPKWSAIGSKDKYVISRGRRMSLRECKQACINLQDMQCKAVMYHNFRKTCLAFAVSDTHYFSERHGTWNSPVYLRTCKQFD
ncbi:uncharacterized protein LOC123545785 isoform X2 [Mercenaria mercenaria]|uniref:uncharacterized protein LOC123545785 isoform X2 n=1 Tax=Mercenaria mercenaria TaxID=6596 RepID=UPI00234EE798|nr:uncharacterized protein LOC123545785 isoform X2 [Mercenaria mercenaria]